jgi:CSLREA domain-containing protein
MQYPHLLPRVLLYLAPAFILLACGEDQPPTAPAEPGGPAFDHTPGHKVVNSVADPGNGVCNATQCTLREAINDPGSTEISFAPGLSGLITLARPGAGGGQLEIDKQLTITGPSGRIVIRGRSPDLAFPIFRIGEGGTVTLTNLTLQDAGGGIVNRGTLRLVNSVVMENSGTGIFSTGALTVAKALVVGNSGFGIAIESRGTATLTNTRIARNSGGGLEAFVATATLTNSTIAGNSGTKGGGIVSLFGGHVTLTKTTVSGNSATIGGGGIFNEGGGLCRKTASVTLINSTVSGNSAPVGAGIYSVGCAGPSVTLTNSTVTRNSATRAGGGIFQDTDEDGTVTLINALVAQNSAPTGPDFLNSNGGVLARFTLIGNGAGSGITNGVDGNQVGGANAPIDPRLGSLADNGGPTKTHALLSGSPAIDAASTPDCPTTDQRGVLRPQGAACDIGSYERQ